MYYRLFVIARSNVPCGYRFSVLILNIIAWYCESLVTSENDKYMEEGKRLQLLIRKVGWLNK